MSYNHRVKHFFGFAAPTGSFLLTALKRYGKRSSVNLTLQFGGA